MPSADRFKRPEWVKFMKLDKLTEEVFYGLVPYLSEGYALTGSGAYKLLLPALADTVIKDIDVIIYPLRESSDLIDREITEGFYITRLFMTKRGFQFSLVHKGLGCWVDLFPRKRTPRFVEVTVDHNRKIKLHNLEEMVYGLCLSTLEKAYGKKTVLNDSIEKLKRLVPYLDMKLFDQIVAENIDQTEYMTPAFNASINTREIIQYVINNCRPYSPSGYKFDNYPVDQAITPNSLQVEGPAIYSQAMGQHLKYLANFDRVETATTKEL